MVGRREIFTAGLLAGLTLPSPASATRAPAPKPQGAYAAAIDRLFAAWWARDFAAFAPAFSDPDVKAPFDGRQIFETYYAKRETRFRGGLFFNGATVIAQVITPKGPDCQRGIEGGYALGDLFLVQFFPGLESPIMERLAYLGTDVLARAEWIGMPNAPSN